MTEAIDAPANPFSARAVSIIIVAVVIALAAFGLLLAFGDDLRSGRDARAHALSVSADGYAGLVELLGDLGAKPQLIRDPGQLCSCTRALLILTPEPGLAPDALPKLLVDRGDAPTLIVLPKWSTAPQRANRAWVTANGLVTAPMINSIIARLAPGLSVTQGTAATPAAPMPFLPRLARRDTAPADQQRLAGPALTPLLLDDHDRIVLAQLDGRPVYILAEPDLLNNLGLADQATARQAWAMIRRLSAGKDVAFDLTFNGFASGKSTIKLLFQPPFLPVTVCVFAAALLAGLHGLIRFGAPEPAARAIAFGKRTLVDNAAHLFRAARKEHRAGAAYATLTRDLTAQATGAPAWLTGEALATHLDRAAPEANDPPFATLAWHAGTVENRDQLVAAAQALYRWRRNRMR